MTANINAQFAKLRILRCSGFIKINIMIGFLFLLLPLAFGNDQSMHYVKEFVGGLDSSKISYCENKYATICFTPATTAADGIAKQWACMKQKMAQDSACIQAYKIRELTYYPATEIKNDGKISVFYITTLADDVNVFYIVDADGRLIALTDDLDLNKNKNYRELKQQFPNVAFTNFIYWEKINENLFPRSYILPNHIQQLVFRQALKDGYCVACKTVGIADVAYRFNAHGAYLGVKLLNVTGVKEKA